MTQPMLQLDRLMKQAPTQIHGWAMSKTFFEALKREIRAISGEEWEVPPRATKPGFYMGIPITISDLAPDDRAIPLGKDGLPLHEEESS